MEVGVTRMSSVLWQQRALQRGGARAVPLCACFELCTLDVRTPGCNRRHPQPPAAGQAPRRQAARPLPLP